jgi:hypothetical protein
MRSLDAVNRITRCPDAVDFIMKRFGSINRIITGIRRDYGPCRTGLSLFYCIVVNANDGLTAFGQVFEENLERCSRTFEGVLDEDLENV